MEILFRKEVWRSRHQYTKLSHDAFGFLSLPSKEADRAQLLMARDHDGFARLSPASSLSTRLLLSAAVVFTASSANTTSDAFGTSIGGVGSLGVLESRSNMKDGRGSSSMRWLAGAASRQKVRFLPPLVTKLGGDFQGRLSLCYCTQTVGNSGLVSMAPGDYSWWAQLTLITSNNMACWL